MSDLRFQTKEEITRIRNWIVKAMGIIIYGTINEKGERWYTQMGRVFDAIKDKQAEYNWLITDTDCVPQKIEELCNGKDYC